jgi:sulfur carrier protein ThiS
LQPEEQELLLPRPKNAQQLLNALGIASCTALVARNGELLTPDRAVYAGDRLLVRKVTSSG